MLRQIGCCLKKGIWVLRINPSIFFSLFVFTTNGITIDLKEETIEFEWRTA